MADKIATWQHVLRSLTMHRAASPCMRFLYKLDPPPLIPTSLARVPIVILGLE